MHWTAVVLLAGAVWTEPGAHWPTAAQALELRAALKKPVAHGAQVRSAEALGGYEPLPERDLFDMEYWDLEQAKLKKGGKPPAFTGEVVLITGAASGIGRAAVDAFLARGGDVGLKARNHDGGDAASPRQMCQRMDGLALGLHPVVGGDQPAAGRVDARGPALPGHHAVPFMRAGPARHGQPAVGSWAPGHLGPHAVADVALGVGGDQVVVYQSPFTGRLVELGNGLGL